MNLYSSLPRTPKKRKAKNQKEAHGRYGADTAADFVVASIMWRATVLNRVASSIALSPFAEGTAGGAIEAQESEREKRRVCVMCQLRAIHTLHGGELRSAPAAGRRMNIRTRKEYLFLWTVKTLTASLFQRKKEKRQYLPKSVNEVSCSQRHAVKAKT